MARKTQKSAEIAERIKREFQADLIADKMIEIADNAKSATDLIKAQQRIDRLKAAAAKMAPWKYGEPGAH
jgi:hypothetical protein